MKVFVLGGGGREHALGWKLAQSPKVSKLFFLPGNAGTAQLGENLPLKPTDVDAVLKAAEKYSPDLILVGPEAPLFQGITDYLAGQGFLVFGPTKKAAMLEQEKAYAKDFLIRYSIPTASSRTFTDVASAHRFIEGKDSAMVVKASGPALGKGVMVCKTPQEALAATDKMMVERKFGDAGKKVLIEERLAGEEASVHILTDGEHFVPFPVSQDHKPVGDGDTGPNTGGMGAYAPAPIVDAELGARIDDEIIKPVLEGLKTDGIDYRGLLYIGLMITEKGPKVLEFNCRFGDPETQPLMMLVDEDLFDLLVDTAKGNLKTRKVKVKKGSALCVVGASAGYPGSYQKGKEVTLELDSYSDVVCFHAGTRKDDSRLLTSGGRVLGITSFAADLAQAKKRGYAPIENKHVFFEGIYFRTDIGDKGIKRG